METTVLSAQLTRSLNDKIYEKRKLAALEIEKYSKLPNKHVESPRKCKWPKKPINYLG